MKKVWFKVSHSEESYHFYIIDKDAEKYEEIADSVFETCIDEANRFIDFFMIDSGCIPHGMNTNRKISPTLRDNIPKFDYSFIVFHLGKMKIVPCPYRSEVAELLKNRLRIL